MPLQLLLIKDKEEDETKLEQKKAKAGVGIIITFITYLDNLLCTLDFISFPSSAYTLEHQPMYY
jgi:hypothetical protein